MDLEQEYIEYIAQFSTALLAISAAYFVTLSQPVTLAALLMIPLLFGYTTYISRESFQRSSLLAAITLMFVFLGVKMAVIALVITLGNILVSFFAHGESFKDYYSATLLPLLFIGLIIGGLAYGAALTQPQVSDQVRSISGDVAGNQTYAILQQTQIIEEQEEVTKNMVRGTSRATVSLTQQYVINETQEDFSASQQQTLNTAFSNAREDVPGILINQTEKSSQQADPSSQIANTVSNSIENLLRGNKFIIFIPMMGMIFYTLQPIVGLFTAIFAALIARASTHVEERSESLKDSEPSFEP